MRIKLIALLLLFPLPLLAQSQGQKWCLNQTSNTWTACAGITAAAAPLASATTIAPTADITHITGTTAINTITPPAPATAGGTYTGCIRLIPDGLWTTTTSGNIALASTAVVSKELEVCYDGTKWYPSY